MSRSRSKILVDKSIEACLGAIEIYNKPSFQYREESFSILMINAWENLLKARILQENDNNIRSIENYEPMRKKDGSKGIRQQAKKNRSGNTMTIGIDRAMAIVGNYKIHSIDSKCVENIKILIEYRDSAIHFHTLNMEISKKIHEIGSAALQNYVKAAQSWFKIDMSKFHFFLMPFSLQPSDFVISSFSGMNRTASMKNFLDYLAEREASFSAEADGEYSFKMNIEVKFIRTSSMEAIPVQISNAPDALKVELSEQQFREKYPWDFEDLVEKMKNRYMDFSRNQKFFYNKRLLEKEEKYCNVRLLNPKNPNSSKKKLYSAAILGAFDKIYSRK